MTDPLSPAEVDGLLRTDPRTAVADLLVLRDALHRLSGACERLATAAEKLKHVAGAVERLSGERDREVHRPHGLLPPPRGD
ncbi:MAG: hypothetical protein M3373_10485 [Gemmatimonadota bacterium]|nr:hypothetical protein [Gemmatimonadota bacterium]